MCRLRKMPIAEIEECIVAASTQLHLQYCGEEPGIIAQEVAVAASNGGLMAVTELDLGGNALQADHVKLLGGVAFSGMPKLVDLDLRHNDLECAGAAALHYAIVHSAKQLTALDVSENKLHDEGAREVLLALLETSLVCLSLGSNQISPRCCPLIAHAILNQPAQSLRRLNLEFNALGDHGVVSLCESLSGASVCWLSELSLSDNSIGDDGIVRGLAPFLISRFCRIRSLNLSVNRIGTAGASALAEVFLKSSTLAVVDLGCNNFGETGGLCIATALANARVLESIDLTSTEMTPAVMVRLHESAQRNKRITTVRTSNNDAVDGAAHRALVSLLDDENRGAKKTATLQWWILAGSVIALTAIGGALLLRRRQ
jgi:Ran GTPase-activating protein (RanGAP) involved in mRNA processing and transport